MTEPAGNEKNEADEPIAPGAELQDQVPGEGDPPVPSPEEQMAQFEEALKEEDWGHQPC